MVDWKVQKIEVPRTELRLVEGKVTLSISPASNGSDTRWQYIDVSLGEHSPTSTEDCQIYWPRRAIELVRAELDRLEATLD